MWVLTALEKQTIQSISSVIPVYIKRHVATVSAQAKMCQKGGKLPPGQCFYSQLNFQFLIRHLTVA